MATKNIIKDIKNVELENAIKELKEYEILKKQAEDRIDEIKSKVRDYMEGIGETDIALGQYVCKLSEASTTNFNKKLVQEEAPDLFERATTKSTYVRLLIK